MGVTPEGVVLAEVIAFCKKVPGLRLSRNLSGRVKTHGRIYAYGCFVPGGSDLLGWRTEGFPERLIGTRVARFVAIEVKAPGEKATPDQQAFLDEVRGAGGIAGVVHSAEEAAALLGLDIRGTEA